MLMPSLDGTTLRQLEPWFLEEVIPSLVRFALAINTFLVKAAPTLCSVCASD